MQEKNSMIRLTIIDLLLFVGWCAVVLGFADYDSAGFYFWGGLSFGVFSFIVAGVSLLLIKKRNNRNTTEISLIPVYYTAAYQFAALIVNTYFIMREAGKMNQLLVVLNTIILVAFIAVRLNTDDYVSHVDKQTRHLAEKIKPITLISSRMATILSVTSDPDIKTQLLKLKEMVDYSSNVSQEFSEETQNYFLLQLNQIQSLIVEHKDKEEIDKNIQEATVTWKMRNSVDSYMK